MSTKNLVVAARILLRRCQFWTWKQNQSTDGPLHLEHLEIGTPINEDANAPLTPRLAQPSGVGWRRCGVPRVFGSWWRFTLGKTLGGTQPHNLLIRGGLVAPPGTTFNSIALLLSHSQFTTYLYKEFHSLDYNTISKGGNKTSNTSCARVWWSDQITAVVGTV